jgi:protein tyrosine phosphatase (PTP) superfamily phosphohydrolase (DUF442 family)
MNSSRITDNLYIGTMPNAKDYDLLRELGVSLVINMRFGFPPKRDPHSPPLRSIWLPVIDSPIFPIPIRAFEVGVHEALKVIESGGVVYVHCSKGRHRGAAMGACILIAQGMSAEEAMRLIEQKRTLADLHAWYIQRRIMKFTQVWVKTAP